MKRVVFRWATAMRWLFLVIFAGWIIWAIIFAFQGKWGKVAIALLYIVGFGLLNFVIIPLGLPRLLRRGAPPDSN